MTCEPVIVRRKERGVGVRDGTGQDGLRSQLGAHSDDLDDGKEDNRRFHGGWELQHGRDIGSYFARGDHPVKRIVACESDGCNPENRENFDHYLNDYVLRAMRITMERLGGKAQYHYNTFMVKP